MTPIEQVLDLARWAPSGDNTQPWRFEITGERACVVHAFDTRRHCVYDLTGAPSQIAVGAMLETARIAATGQGMRAEIERLDSDDEHPRFAVRLLDDPAARPDPLIPFIISRCTHRRPYSRRPLTAAEKQALQVSVGSAYSLLWFEGARRAEVANLLFASAKIRLTIPEAYAVHREVIEWHAQFSETKIPDQAVGLDPVGMALMRWAMKSWERTHFLSAYLGGTLLPRIQLEYLPALGCAAHVAIVAERPPASIDDWLRAGAAVQRLWLTAASLGLQHQPEMTPLIFSDYARAGVRFTDGAGALALAHDVNERLQGLFAPSRVERVLWLGRIGYAANPAARSTRLPLDGLSATRPEPAVVEGRSGHIAP
jgi:nitroreductase